MISSCGNNNDSITSENKSNSNEVISFTIPYNEGYIEAIVDNESNRILFESPSDLNLENLTPNIELSEGSKIIEELVIDFSEATEIIVQSESGINRKYTVNYYTQNLLKNPKGENNGEHWYLCSQCGVEKNESDELNFFGRATSSSDLTISQEIYFEDDYSNLYILFIGNLWTEKTVVNSITRHPYLWAHQKGNFKEDDWPFLQGMLHEKEANEWEIVSGIHQLLPNITSVYFRMSSASQVGDENDGTKNKFKDIEIRIFKSEGDAEFYESIYSNNN